MGYISVLKRRSISILWFSQLLSAIGDQVYLVCASWLAAQSSVHALALVAGSEYVSALIASFWAGRFADQKDKKQLMIFADFIRALAVFTLPLAGSLGHIAMWHLISVGIILGALSALFDPCLIAIIPKLVNDDHLLRATNGLMDFTKRLSRVLGPALAGLLATFISIHLLFILNALSFAISAVGVIYTGRYLTGPVDRNETGKKSQIEKSAFSDLIGAIKLLRGHNLLIWEFSAFFFVNALYGIAYIAGLPLIARQKFGDNIGAYGVLVSTYGSISVIANLIMGNRKVKNEPLTIFLGYTMWGFGFFLLAVAPNLVLGALGLAIGALASPMSVISLITIIQREIPEKDIGKVYSLRNAITYAGLGLGLVLTSYLFSHWQTTTIMIFAAFGFFLIGTLGILRFSYYTRKQL